MFSSGGLGDWENDNFQVYVCFQGHPCLSVLRKVQHVGNTDAMCYAYSKEREMFFPLSLKSELKLCRNSDIVN